MTKKEKQAWLKVTKAKFTVRELYFHHHALEIMNSHPILKESFISALCDEITIETMIRENKKKGVKADNINKEVRRLLESFTDPKIKFEVMERRGVFFFSEEQQMTGGFDFAILNHKRNVIALRNFCFGEFQHHKGENIWTTFLQKNPELEKIMEQVLEETVPGEDYELPESDNPLILGEIQFGNWALSYRDFFKVLQADIHNNVDALIYIAPTAQLEKHLSTGIVTFQKVKRILKEFEKVISVPVWVIGLDYEPVEKV